MANKLKFPCNQCGTMLNVNADAEFTYCTTCGSRIELGIHSYRVDSSGMPNIYCKVCNQLLDPLSKGTIFSCNTCIETLCSICAVIRDNKHYCPNCIKTNTKEKNNHHK